MDEDEDETINEQIILTEDEINKIGKYIYDRIENNYILGENYKPFQFIKLYNGIKLNFSILKCYDKKHYSLHFSNDNYIIFLKEYDDLTELFNEVNTFENFVYCNNTVITKSQYDAIILEINKKNRIKKNADDVIEIIERLCKK
uniref:Uncharacterized protein n=1 Tax=viral metagenome TaxID=1070528 RepID=A0A6C0H714_9ZZZZ